MVLSLALFAIVSTALLAYLGYGLAKLLLPREWRSAEAYLAPLIGYLLLLLVGYYALRTVLNLTAAIFLLLGLATALNGLALWRRRGEGLALELPEHGWAWLIALAAFILAALPLLNYGYSVPIGENWDPENYLAITDYLLQVPVGRIREMPPNPLRELNAEPPRIGLTLGFSVLAGTVQQLRGWDAWQSFSPTIALLYALTALALYGLFRQGFQIARRPALLATVAGGGSALALWIAFFNFGMQMAALPLVPLALTLWLAALRKPSWQTVLLAAMAAAAIPVAYYPALTAYVPMALGLGLCELVRARGRGTVLLAGLGTALLSTVIAWGTICDYQAGFAFRYGQQMTTLGLFHFPSWPQALGLAPFAGAAEAPPPLGSGIQAGGLFIALLLAAAALLGSRRRWSWLAALLPAILYLGWLRGWFWPAAAALGQNGLLSPAMLERLRPYPYAYLKGAAFIAPLVLALAVDGWDVLWDLAPKRLGAPRVHVARGLLVGLLLLPLGLTAWADGQLVARYWERPAHFDREAIQVEEAVSLLPPEATVYLTGRPERSRVVLGLFAYFLREHPVYGRLSTAYAGFDRRVPGDAPAYALLDADDDPHPLGFFPDGRVWSGGNMVLYRRDPSVLSFLDLRDDAYSQRPAGEIHTDEPLNERLLLAFGTYPALTAENPLTLYGDAERLGRAEDLSGKAGSRALLIAVAADRPADLTLSWEDGTSEELALPAGFSVGRSRPHTFPTRVEVAPEAGTVVWACWAALVEGSLEATVQAYPEEAIFRAEADAIGTTLNVQLQVYNDTGRPLRLALETWENTFQNAHHYAWWGPARLPEQGVLKLRVDLEARQAEAQVGGLPIPFPPHPGADDWPAAADGSYFAALWVYYGSRVLEVLPVGHFQVAQGQVQNLQPIALSTRLVWPHSPGQPSGTRFGPAIELAAHAWQAGPFAAGDQLPLALEWHALEPVQVDYYVTAQVVGDGRLWGQWDGPAGQWYPATAWQPGQHIRDDIPLAINPDTPAGRYRLIVAVYDLATMQRLPVRSPTGEELGDVLDLGEIVVR